MKSLKSMSLLLYFIISLFFMELIFRASTTGMVFTLGLIISFLFSTLTAIVYFIICSRLQRNINYILSSLVLLLSAFVFSSQLIYFKFFRTFYSIYSAGNTGQILEFWKDIWNHMIKNAHWILLLFLPAIIMIIFGRKMFTFKKPSIFRIGLLFGSFILIYVISIGTIYAGGKEQHSAYDLYFKNKNITISMDRLGLITTMRLDLQRLVFNWSPSLNESFLESPPLSDKTDNIKDEEKIEYNIMDIDFAKLISNEQDETLKGMHKYFESVQPTPKNEYTGKYQGYNLILITAEGFSPFAVHEDVTPTLYKMVNEGYNFTNFYTPIWDVSTTDGEYVALTGLIPKNGVWSFQKSGDNYLPFVMGNQLKGQGYKTVAYHNHYYNYYRRDISHPNMGYDYKGLGNGLNVKEIWPESDLEMVEITIPEYINNQPFHAYYMTVSGHMQYSFIGNNMAYKNKNYVENLPYSEQGKAYIATQIELDKALEHLLTQLESAGIADKTLIALSADHYPYGLDDQTINELAGHEVEKNFELYKSTFILYTKGMKPVTINRPSSSLDIIPTLSNLLGLEFDSRLLMGRDIFSDSDPLVIFHNKSFITDKGRYNSITQEFIPKKGEVVDEDYANQISSIINSKFYYSAKILETDYYRKVFYTE